MQSANARWPSGSAASVGGEDILGLQRIKTGVLGVGDPSGAVDDPGRRNLLSKAVLLKPQHVCPPSSIPPSLDPGGAGTCNTRL